MEWNCLLDEWNLKAAVCLFRPVSPDGDDRDLLCEELGKRWPFFAAFCCKSVLICFDSFDISYNDSKKPAG